MRTIPLGISFPPKNHLKPNHSSLHFSNSFSSPSIDRVRVPLSAPITTYTSTILADPSHSISGICRASQAVEFFPSVRPEVVVREARLEDCWEVAETHCSSFFPDYSFPLDLALRINRLVGVLSGFSVPDGCLRTCLVAVNSNSFNDNFYFGSEDFKVGGFEWKFSFNKGSVAGILTIDTVADFLPRKGPLRQRRTGIAYISNVAVRQSNRRKGIAKKLVAKAEAVARSWGCRAIALHCDANNPVATQLYLGQGFRCIKVPDRANWPEPKTSLGTQFNFMMKLLTTGSSVSTI